MMSFSFWGLKEVSGIYRIRRTAVILATVATHTRRCRTSYIPNAELQIKYDPGALGGHTRFSDPLLISAKAVVSVLHI